MIVSLSLPISDLELREEYAKLTPRELHGYLDGSNADGLSIFGMGVLKDTLPIGIALATGYPHLHQGHIHLLTVKDQDSHLIETLLTSITKVLNDHKITSITFLFPQESPEFPLIEQLFLKNRWKGPYPFMIECLLKRADFHPAWLNKTMTLANGFEEFLFKNLTAEEQEDLMHRFEQGGIPPTVFPLGKEKNLIEYQNSLGLRYQGRVIGWMITHRIAPDTIRYSALYLEDEFAYTGYWLKLLVDSIKIHLNLTSITYGQIQLNLSLISNRWLKFIEKRLFPESCQIAHIQMFFFSLPY